MLIWVLSMLPDLGGRLDVLMLGVPVLGCAERTCLTISSIFTLFISMIYVPPDQRMQRLSVITQRLLFVNVLALVSPSPVRLAMVNVQKPSPPNPSAE